MKSITRVLAVLGFAGWAGSVSAIPITDTVTVDGTEWAQVDLFTNLSYFDIDAICDASAGGVCGSGTLNGWDMEDWTWALVEDVNALFNSYLGAADVSGVDLLGPGPDSYSELSSSWASSFFDDGWRPLLSDATTREATGITRSSPAPDAVFLGQLTDYYGAAAGSSPDVALSNDFVDTNLRSATVGAYFYRASTTVPAPATLALFGIGLAGLGWTRRKKA